MIHQMNCTVGLSGGVDSSVAAYLLKQNFNVNAVFMRNWDGDDCPWQEDYQRAVQVATQLDIDLQWINGSALYLDKVFKRFINDLYLGLTPNPDIWCNEFVKFELLSQIAENQLIATGHYARILNNEGIFSLHRAFDLNKDQSYFLSRIPLHRLANIIFPLGELNKSEVRTIAANLNLITAYQKESMGICFIGPNNYRLFLKNHIVTRPGSIFTDTDEYLGKHQGLLYYTLGQRKGLGVGGVKGYPELPWYVIKKNLENNSLILSQQQEHRELMRDSCTLKELNWLAAKPTSSYMLYGQFRHRQTASLCHIEICEDTVNVIFLSPQWALTPGQHLVLYDQDKVLASGIIQTFPDYAI